LYVCGGCHTPKLPNGDDDPSRYLAGVECVFDVDPAPGRGCIHSKNLTNHPRGLSNVSDDQAIKDMFLSGRRPDGKLLQPVMPYSEYHHMPPEHADAIVAFLRRVPGVDHLVPASEPPFDRPPEVAHAPVDLALVPEVPALSREPESARRGRKLAVAACLGCHTPPPAQAGPGSPPLDLARIFAGGRRFRSAVLRLPSPPQPEVVYSQNLTSHATGLAGWSVEDVVRVLKEGKDRKGEGVCQPMPAGPGRAYGGLSPGDARDIANYLITLPPIENALPLQCVETP
jgi:mono/diheme cytochrome c family protein